VNLNNNLFDIFVEKFFDFFEMKFDIFFMNFQYHCFKQFFRCCEKFQKKNTHCVKIDESATSEKISKINNDQKTIIS
jgi:hypothetical protein